MYKSLYIKNKLAILTTLALSVIMVMSALLTGCDNQTGNTPETEQGTNPANASTTSATEKGSETSSSPHIEEEEVAGLYLSQIADGTWQVDKYEGTLTEITIPKTHLGQPVTGIGNMAFFRCTSLTKVNIPDSVTYIDDSAFESCIHLTSINIPAAVTYIGTCVFAKCSDLTNIAVDPQNKSYRIQDNCLIGIETNTLYTGLKGCVIPDGVTTIAERAFYERSDLESVIIPDSVTSIDKSAFQNCVNLTSVTLNNSIQNIGSSAFWGCKQLVDINLPATIKSIGSGVFYNCSSLTSIVVPNGATVIGLYTFAYCKNLTDVTLPSTVTTVEQEAFKGCDKLANIVCSPDIKLALNQDRGFYGISDDVTITDSTT